MKRLLVGVTLAAQVALPAMAADLEVRAPVYSAATPFVYSWWTGCYVGGNVGFALSQAHSTHDNGLVVETFNFNPNAFIGGLQVGCNYQWNSLVFGVEATWSGTGLKQTRQSALLINRESSISIDQIATVTGRLGHAFDRTMLYVKAGWAGVRVNARAVNTVTGAFADFTDFGNGWTIGAGIEHVPWQNIIVGMEFNYYSATLGHSGLDSVGAFSRNFDTRADIYALTLRLSYLFGQTTVTNY